MGVKILSRLSTGAFGVAAAFMVMTVAVLLLPFEVNVIEDQAHIFFSIRDAPGTDCADFAWQVGNIRTVHVNGNAQIGEGQARICGEEPVLQVKFQDGSLHEYRTWLTKTIRLQSLLLLALASCMAGFALRSQRLVDLFTPTLPAGLQPWLAVAGVMLALGSLFALAVTLPASPAVAHLLPIASNGTPGLGHIILVALITTIVYWVYTPPLLRPGVTLLMSVILFALEGASLPLVALVILLALIVQLIAADPPQDVPQSTAKTNPLLGTASLVYLAVLLFFLPLAGQTPDLPLLPLAIIVALAAIGICLKWPQIKRPSLPASASAHRPSGLVWNVALVFCFLLLAETIITAWTGLPLTGSDFGVVSIVPLTLLGIVALSILHRTASKKSRLWLGRGLVVYLLIVFIALKSTVGVAIGITGWIGFSYITFRLLHVLFERFAGRDTGNASPLDMLLYILFFPALLVGPIDRLPHFLGELPNESITFQWPKAFEGVTRILIGGIKKFFLADLLLAHIALARTLPPDLGIPFSWLQLYASAFYLLLDFSGFIDIAIGLGLLLGYSLPENFNTPYLKNNLAQFWQSWHITLSGWLRTYIFLPLSRTLLQTRLGKRPTLVVFCAHMTTMLLIGLWHGIALNFALWGLWHGFGLFGQKVFSDHTRRWQLRLKKKRLAEQIMNGLGILLTFHFVALGWVLFLLANPADSLAFARRLFGIP